MRKLNELRHDRYREIQEAYDEKRASGKFKDLSLDKLKRNKMEEIANR